MVYGTLVQVANRIKRHNRYFAFEKAENCLEILGNMNQYIMENNACVGMTFTGIDYIEDENELIIVWKDCTINKLKNGDGNIWKLIHELNSEFLKIMLDNKIKV